MQVHSHELIHRKYRNTYCYAPTKVDVQVHDILTVLNVSLSPQNTDGQKVETTIWKCHFPSILNINTCWEYSLIQRQ